MSTRVPLVQTVTALAAVLAAALVSAPGAGAHPAPTPQQAASAAAVARCPLGIRAVPTAQPDPEGYATAVDATSASDVWQVGSSRPGNTVFTPRIWHGDGARMTVVPTDAPSGYSARFTSVSAVTRADVWFAGVVPTAIASDTGTILLSHYDGTAVTAAPSPVTSITPYPPPQVSARTGDDAWLVGSALVGQVGQVGHEPFTAHWDGSAWSRVPAPPMGSGQPTSVYAAAGGAWVGGKGLWRRQASTWVRDTSVADLAYVTDLGGSGGAVLMTYTTTTGAAAVARYEGGRWAVLAPPIVPGRIRSLQHVSVAPDGSSWLAGSYDRSSPLLTSADVTSFVARWDGARWQRTDVAFNDQLVSFVGAFVDDLAAVSGQEVRVVGSRLRATTESNSAFSGEVCGPVVSATGVHPATATVLVPGTSTLVMGAPGLGSAVPLTDDLGALPPLTVAPGGSTALAYPAAGTYTAHVGTGGGAASTLTTAVGLATYPGRFDTTYVLWALTALPDGYTAEAQILRPGSAAFRTIKPAVPGGTYAKLGPNGGSGSYQYRARLVRTADGATSGWSPTLTLTVP